VLAEAPGHRAWPRFEREWTARISSKEVAEVNGLNEMIPTALLFLLVFLVMGVMILWGISLLDLPG
jgi:hypothetical protein